MQAQVGLNFGVSVNDLTDEVGTSGLLVSEVGGCDQAFDVEVVRVKHQADERLAVIGLGDAGLEAADVGEDDEAEAFGGLEGVIEQFVFANNATSSRSSFDITSPVCSRECGGASGSGPGRRR